MTFFIYVASDGGIKPVLRNKIRFFDKHYKINCVVILPAIKTSGKICFGIYTGIELMTCRAAESKIPFNHFGRYFQFFNQVAYRYMIPQDKQFMPAVMRFSHAYA